MLLRTALAGSSETQKIITRKHKFEIWRSSFKNS